MKEEGQNSYLNSKESRYNNSFYGKGTNYKLGINNNNYETTAKKHFRDNSNERGPLFNAAKGVLVYHL